MIKRSSDLIICTDTGHCYSDNGDEDIKREIYGKWVSIDIRSI